MRRLLIGTGVVIAAVVFGLCAAATVGAIALRSGPISSLVNSNQQSAPGLGTPIPQAGTLIAPGTGSPSASINRGCLC